MKRKRLRDDSLPHSKEETIKYESLNKTEGEN